MEFTQIIKDKLNDNQRKVWKGNSPFAASLTVNDFSVYKKKRVNYIARLELEKDEYNDSLDAIKKARKDRIDEEKARVRRAEWAIEQKRERRKKVALFFLKLPISPILILKAIIVGLIKWAKASEIGAYSLFSLMLSPLAIIGALLLSPCIIKVGNANSEMIKWFNFAFILMYSLITYIIGVNRIKDEGYGRESCFGGTYNFYKKDAFFIKLIDTLIIFAYMVIVTYLTLWLQTLFAGTSTSIVCYFIMILTPLILSIVTRIGGEDDYGDYFGGGGLGGGIGPLYGLTFCIIALIAVGLVIWGIFRATNR